MSTPTLKIGPLPDKTPVKLSIALDPELQAELTLYTRVYEQAYGDKPSIASIIPSMLQTFLASGPGFKRARKTLSNNHQSSTSKEE